MSLDESDSEMPVFLRYFVAASQRYARRLEATSGLPVELAVMSAPRQRRSVLARLMTKGKEQPSK